MASSNPQQTNISEQAAQAIKVVEGKLGQGILIPSRDLFYTLGLGFVKKDDFTRLVIQCYRLAKKRSNWSWVEQAQLDATVHFSNQWILNNMPHKNKKRNRVSLPKVRVQPDRDVLAPSRDIRYYGESAVPDVSSNLCPPREKDLSEPEEIELQPGHISPLRDISNIGASPKDPVTVEIAEEVKGPGCISSETQGSSGSGKLLSCLGGGVSVTLSTDTSTEMTRQVTLHGELPPVIQPLLRGTGSSCPYMGCGTRTRSLRAHVNKMHLPKVFYDEVPTILMSDPAFQERRVHGLRVLRQLLFSQEGPLEDIIPKIKDSECLKGDCLITLRASKEMVALCNHTGWKLPDHFRLKPLNSPACLIHWCCLVAVLNLLSAEQRRQFFDKFKGARSGKKVGQPSSKAQTSGGPLQGSRAVPACRDVQNIETMNQMETDTNTAILKDTVVAIDSHIHLDRVARKLWGRASKASKLSEVLNFNLKHKPTKYLDLVCAVAVYCDPEEFPSVLPTDPSLRIAIGVHPRKIQQFTPALEERFCELLANPRLVALGEIGLDMTEPRDTWPFQQEVFCNLLASSCVRKLLVLHLRGNESEEGVSLYSRALSLVRQYCAPLQPIHLHCFKGRKEDIAEWTSVFTNCYFGFTALVTSFSGEQRLGLSEVPLNRLLLEKDAPYFPTHTGLSWSTPAFLGDAGDRVARRRGMEYGELMRCALENTRRLYRFP